MKALPVLVALAVSIMTGCAGERPLPPEAPVPENAKRAIFAGGCFWCMQPLFDETNGVVRTVVGYTGGAEKDADYRSVSSGGTDHREAIEVTYDPDKVTYPELLQVFWHNIDPTQANGQFADIGRQYETAIYYLDDAQKAAAEASKSELGAAGKFDKPIATEIVAGGEFWPAEEYHQKYYLKNAAHYLAYKEGSGRAGFIRKHWK